MQVAVAYADQGRKLWLKIDVPEGTTVAEAIDRSGILGLVPQIDLAKQKIGIFGKLVKPDAALRAGDRVEIYRPIVCDPKTVPRRFAAEDEDE